MDTSYQNELSNNCIKSNKVDKNINPDLTEKIFYSAFKLMLFDYQKRLDLYEPKLDFVDRTFKVINTETNEILNHKFYPDILKEIFGNYYFSRIRDNYGVLLKSIKNGLISPDDLYEFAKNNDGASLEDIYDKTCETDPELIEFENRFQEKLESCLSKSSKESKYPSKYTPRYCPRCQESPCMCSDPDPD